MEQLAKEKLEIVTVSSSEPDCMFVEFSNDTEIFFYGKIHGNTNDTKYVDFGDGDSRKWYQYEDVKDAMLRFIRVMDKIENRPLFELDETQSEDK